MDSLQSADIKNPDTSYRLVFRGKIADGRDLGNIKRDFSRLFRLDSSRVDAFFSGKPFVLKKCPDHQTAVRYEAALKEIGILCTLDSVPNEGKQAVPAAPDEVRKNSSSQNAATLSCPKCGYVQPDSLECARCGLIINKHRQATTSAHVTGPSITFYDTAKENRQLWLLAFLTLLLIVLVYLLWTNREISHPPGVLIRSEPVQVMIGNPKPWRIGSRVFVPLAEFGLRARVLSSERYHLDAVADIAPIDLALGWGPMSDQSTLDQLEIAQGNRRFVLVPRGQCPPLSWAVLLSHSSNMHMIPADEQIKKSLFSIRTGDLIQLSGYLIGIQENGQWTWFSSLTRTDSGDGACEIVWVQGIKVITGNN